MAVDLDKLKVGDRVKAQRDAPAKGTWKRYDGRVGTVKQIIKNQWRSGTEGREPVAVNEVGVDLDNGVRAWFRPDELILHGRAPRSS